MRLLLVEDDEAAASYLVKGLAESGHVTDHTTDGEIGLRLARSGDYDVLVVDRMLPGRDGLSLIAALRREGVHTPTLILSALGAVDERVDGLRAGSDDYLANPFSFSELLARLESLARRARAELAAAHLRVADLDVDRVSRSVSRAGRPIRLQPREFRLLEYLARHAGQVVTRTMLLEHVWGYNFDPQTNVVDVHVSRLRAKIDKQFHPPLLETIRGVGYALRAP